MTSGSPRRPTADQRLWAAVGPRYVVTLLQLGDTLRAELHRRGARPADPLLTAFPYNPDKDRARFAAAITGDTGAPATAAHNVLALLDRVEADCAASLQLRIARAHATRRGRSA